MVDPQSSPWGSMLSHGHPCRLDDLRIPKFDTQPYGVSENRVAHIPMDYHHFHRFPHFPHLTWLFVGIPYFQTKPDIEIIWNQDPRSKQKRSTASSSGVDLVSCHHWYLATWWWGYPQESYQWGKSWAKRWFVAVFWGQFSVNPLHSSDIMLYYIYMCVFVCFKQHVKLRIQFHIDLWVRLKGHAV